MSSGAPMERYVIDTSSGVRLDLDDPRPEDIRVEDVAGGLLKVCRFGAQAREYYSVAQHALLVQRLVVEAGYPELALAALHHDSHEAYLCDIPTPLKEKIEAETSVYAEACDVLDRAIARAFGFERPDQGSDEQRVIKHADELALLIEAKVLLQDGGKALREDRRFGEEFRDPPKLGKTLSPEIAEKMFIDAHADAICR